MLFFLTFYFSVSSLKAMGRHSFRVTSPSPSNPSRTRHTVCFPRVPCKILLLVFVPEVTTALRARRTCTLYSLAGGQQWLPEGISGLEGQGLSPKEAQQMPTTLQQKLYFKLEKARTSKTKPSVTQDVKLLSFGKASFSWFVMKKPGLLSVLFISK